MLRAELECELEQMAAAGTLKGEAFLSSPQGARVSLENGRSVINLCANDYLGLANDPGIVQAARGALDRWGFGLASVRFIAGTLTLHRELEERVSWYLGTEDTILYSSCFDANAGLFEALLDERDAVISDALNHASIIDGIRLCKARRVRYPNGDLDTLERRLADATTCRRRLVATDGVFSMDGYYAKLVDICELAGRYDALVMVDDSHATGFIGPTGRGTPELFGVQDRIDIYTGTFGKALGGGSGGYVSGRREIVQLLRQRSRPYLFSNALAPAIVAATIAAIDRIAEDPRPRAQLLRNAAYLRRRLDDCGLQVLPGTHPIVPIMFGDARVAARFAEVLLDEGVWAVAFSYPVVPMGAARIRTQLSSAHSPADLDHAVAAFSTASAAVAQRQRGE